MFCPTVFCSAPTCLFQAAAMQKDLLYLQEQHDSLGKDRDRLACQLKAVNESPRVSSLTATMAAGYKA
jgi:hypothetical protein